MNLPAELSQVDVLLAPWKPTIGDDYQGYRNHVCRMVQFCWLLHDCSAEEKQKVMIAAAFHDIGIWIENTVDYIPPSLPPAKAYLNENGLDHWWPEIELMISEHHKVTPVKNSEFPLVEVFRRADLVDFSMGMVKFGLSSGQVREVLNSLSNEGFHKSLGKRAFRWFLKHPLNPAPMMKW